VVSGEEKRDQEELQAEKDLLDALDFVPRCQWREGMRERPESHEAQLVLSCRSCRAVELCCQEHWALELRREHSLQQTAAISGKHYVCGCSQCGVKATRLFDVFRCRPIAGL
jgi:hypothetical protein